MKKEKFKCSWLRWKIEKDRRTFRVYVVEPKEYSPEFHNTIFLAALRSFLNPKISKIETPENTYQTMPEKFDLITFPEAFLTNNELIDFISSISGLSGIGCIHVGLKPSESKTHLFCATELLELVSKLQKIPEVNSCDLMPFFEWAKEQEPSSMFNIACLFTIDVNDKIRVCLHPKVVRSKFEVSGLHEKNMQEADYLTLVTLEPQDNTVLAMTLQPLICSDALSIPTDRPNCQPLNSINAHGNCFKDGMPDHIDIVSLTLCTPQQATSNGAIWHNQFRESFQKAASDDSYFRHHYSTFVLSNFSKTPDNRIGGLSGAFIPVPLPRIESPDFISYLCWASEEDGADYRWLPTTNLNPKQTLGYIASLAPSRRASEEPASMIGFTILRLPRDSSPWRPEAKGLCDFCYSVASSNPETNEINFVVRNTL